MTESSAGKSKTTTLSDLLEGPFDLIVYGELFEGFKVAYNQLSERMKKRVKQIMVDHDIALYPSNPAHVQQWNDEFREKYNEFARPGLATIHGYRHGGAVTVLSEPALFLVIGFGESCAGGGSIFPDGEYSMWTMDYPTIRCEIEGGTAQELLMDAEDSDDEFDHEDFDDDSNEDGILIRDGTGKTYFIPGDLESFEVLDETEKSELWLAPFEDRDELSINVASTGDPAERAAFRQRAQFRQRLAFKHQFHAHERATPDDD